MVQLNIFSIRTWFNFKKKKIKIGFFNDDLKMGTLTNNMQVSYSGSNK